MNLLKTILIYLSLIFSVSAQNMADTDLYETMTAPTPTPYVTEVPATPAPTEKPTPVPTIDISPNPDYKTLKVGDSGDAVRDLQQKLAEYGYFTGDIDGRYGNQTRRAVEQFQYAHGLSADGMAGKVTLTVLYDSNQVRIAGTNATATPEPQPTPEPEPAAISIVEAGTVGAEKAVLPEEEPEAAPEAEAQPEETEKPAEEAGEVPEAEQPEEVPAEEPEAAGEQPEEPEEEPEQAPEEEPGEFLPIELTVPEEAAEEAAPEEETAEETPVEEEPDEGEGELNTDEDAVSELTLMEGYKLLVNGDAPVVASEDEETPFYPCYFQGEIYIPLARSLSAAGINVLMNTSIEQDEIAFVIGDEILNLTYTQNQAGDPVELQVYRGIEPQIVQNRQLLDIGGELYLSLEAVKSITGAEIDVDDTNLVVKIVFPLPADDEE